MRRAIITLLVLLSFGLKAQVYQAMPQAGYGPVKRMLFDSVLTIPLNINQLRNITGGRDAGQIRYNVTDSGLYVYSGYQWIKANLDSTNISNRINGKLNISDTMQMLSVYLRKLDTASLSRRIDLRVKYSDTAAMLDPYLRKLDTASLSDRINKKQNAITLTTNFKSGASTLVGATLNIPKYSDTLQDNYVPYVGAIKDVDLGAYKLNANTLQSDYLLQVKNTPFSITPTSDYTSITPDKTGFVFYTSWLQGQSTYTQSNRFNYANQAQQNNTREYNLPVRNGTLALVEDTVNLSNRINLKADKATVLTINGVGYDLSANRTWTIPTFDSTSISNRINLKLNISDTASMLSPYLRKADTSSLSNRIDLRVKYSDTAAMLSPYLKSAVTSVGLSMPAAFNVSNSPITSTGTLAVTGAGNTSQYIDGTGALQTMQGIVTEVETLVKEVYNETGATLTKGTVVFINGGHGNLPTVTKAAASSDSLSAQTFGLVKADISDNSNGYVIVIGDLIDMPTSAFLEGTQLYLSPTAGLFTSTKQYAPSHLVYVGVVTRSHPTQGVISVKIQNGYEMDELHNVSAQSPSNNSLLQYKTSTNLWTKVDGTTSNIAEGTNLYYTDARVSNKMNYTDTVSLSNRINTKADALSGTTNTVPKFTSGTTIGNSNIKDDGNAVSISTTAGSNGALQVGSYGGNILMNTNNSTGGLIFQNTSSSNKLWDISSFNNDLNINESNVALAPPRVIFKAGGNVIVSNLAGSGTRMVVADASGVLSTQSITGVDTTSLSNRINLKLNISDTASMLSAYLRKVDTSSLSNRINTKQNTITLTTTGTSGAATFSSNTLNIPQYQAAGTYVTSVTGTSPIVSSGGTTPAISIPAATSSVNGYLSSTDWSTFNGKESALTFSSPLVRTTNTISIPVATTSVNGYLSATDWTTFNNKQSTLTNPVTGTGTNNYIAKFTTTGSTIGNSLIFDNGTNVGIGTASPSGKFHVEGTSGIYYNLSTASVPIIQASGSLSDIALKSVGTGGNVFLDAPSGVVYFNTASTIRMLINASGNVGIGSTSPTNLITLQKLGSVSTTPGIDFRGTLSLGGAYNSLDYNSGRIYGVFDADSYTSARVTIAYPTGAGTFADGLSVKNGNVGIGTPSPSYPLHLKNATYSQLFIEGGTTADLILYNSGGSANTRTMVMRQTSSNYLTFFSANDNGTINTNNILTLTNGGNVGIGTTSPSQPFHVYASSTTTSSFFETNSTNSYIGLKSTSGICYVGNVSYNMTFEAGGAERMRITSGGEVQINGTTSASGASKLTLRYDGTSNYPITVGNESVSGGLIRFAGNGSGVLGSITHNGTNVAYNTSSDYRLKEDFKEFNGLELISKIKTYDYAWKSNKSRMYGFIAHELQDILPYTVNGKKDEVDENGNAIYQGVDYSKLVPILIKGMQEQQAQIKDLQTKIQTLENK